MRGLHILASHAERKTSTKKMKKTIAKYMLIIIILVANVLAMRSTTFGAINCLNISTTGDINLGLVASGVCKYYTYNPPTITFTITSCESCNIRIIKLTDIQINGFAIETEWKMGENTGYENAYSNGIYTLNANRYYVTAVIKSIKPVSLVAGRFGCSPSISVERVN